MNGKGNALFSLILALLLGVPLASRAQPAPASPPLPPISVSTSAPANSAKMPPVLMGGTAGASAGRAGLLKSFDSLISELSAATADLKKLASGGASAIPYDESEGALITVPERVADMERGCREHFSPKNLSGVVFPDALELDVVAYAQCRAVVEKDPAACASLDHVQFKTPLQGLSENCRRLTANLAFAPSVISHSPDAMDRCLEWAAQTGKTARAGAENVRKVCGLIVSRADSSAVAPQIAAILKLGSEEAAEIENTVGALKGEEKTCAKFSSGKHAGEDCQAFAAFRKAYAAKSASACGKSSNCRLMMLARGGNCGAFGKTLSASYCRESSQDKIQEQAPLIKAQEAKWAKDQQEHPKLTRKGKFALIMQQKIAAADALVFRLNQEFESYQPKNTPAFKTRKDRFVALRNSLQEISREFRGATSAKGAARPKTSPTP
jgi:hypothetical protein